MNNAVYNLARKKVKLKTIEVVRYAPLFHSKNRNQTWFGCPEMAKYTHHEHDRTFIKWVELKDSFEVEVD